MTRTAAASQCDSRHIATCGRSSGTPQAAHTLDARRCPMCLGVPGEIIEVKKNTALVDFWGTRRTVRMDNLAVAARPGQFIIDHAGYAVRVIPQAEVADTLALYEVLLTEAGEDPIARDVCAELDGGILAEDQEAVLV
ncbi:MAG TPA: HypC/HybG/HupF family hydrogenase formation chaperone [Thermoanaerobaculia bacterium]|nr:HypC/HybG/HupF family hydrogenase formation chaperone [Thermoanaerobaculia bacterium]